MVLSLVLNSVLIFFIYKHSTVEFGTYRALMFILALFNIMYSITLALVMPVIHIYDLSFFLFTSGLGPVPKCASRLLTAVFASLFAQSLYLIALQFVYRYIQVVRPSARFFFGKGRYILLALYAFIAIDYGAICFFNFGPSLVKDAYLAKEMELSYGLDINDIGYIGPVYTLNGEVQWFDVSGLLNVSIVIGSTLALIPYCGVATFRSLYRHGAISEITKKRQKQMFRLLLIQSFFSLAFTFIPSSAIIVLSLLRSKIGPNANVLGISLAVYPVIEPLVVLYFVSSYHRAIRRYLGMVNHVRHHSSSLAKF
ncbi:7TM chemoreceptor [Trichostrongylus colubriformis]|uniref:7TM chemoreceptor n=1 Tax=Trichostrongylus colubriformis TaxID=6319 RepID=A0AAN8FEA1_TRICO